MKILELKEKYNLRDGDIIVNENMQLLISFEYKTKEALGTYLISNNCTIKGDYLIKVIERERPHSNIRRIKSDSYSF